MKEFLIGILLLLSACCMAQPPEPTPGATGLPIADPAPRSESKPEVNSIDAARDRDLVVGVSGSEPFVVMEGRSVQGLSVEVWEALAKELDLDFEVVRAESVSDVLQGVQDGRFDVGVGALSITSERSTFVDFTQPYYDSSLGILSLAKRPERKTTLRADLIGLAMALGTLLLVLGLVGALFWAIERKANTEQFPDSAAEGIGNGMWMALVTATTVGYGDKAPITPLGRVLTGVWMLITTVTLSSFTAWLATTLTVQRLEENFLKDASELNGKRVAVVTGTTSEVFARHFTSLLVQVDDYQEGVERLEEGAVDAMVYDYPILRYYLSKHPEVPMRLAESTFALQDYGFCLQRGDRSLHRYNVGLLRLVESGTIRDISEHWLSHKRRADES